MDDLAAVRARLRQRVVAASGKLTVQPVDLGDVLDYVDGLEAALHAQAARLATALQAVANAEEHFKVLPYGVTEADVLGAYPCASPTCQSEQCILGRQMQAQAARLAAVEPIVAAVERFIDDSEDQGGPPHETCNACYWALRSAVLAGRDAE